MKHFGITALALSALLTLAACGGESGADGASSSASEASSGGGEASFPEMSDAKGPGTISGTIAGNPIDVEGVCSSSPGSFDFWTDGTDFASANDVDGDGQYLILNVINMNGTIRKALRYSRGGETLYNGLVSTESFDGKTLTVNTMLGRAQEISADFTISCD